MNKDRDVTRVLPAFAQSVDYGLDEGLVVRVRLHGE